jgi:hypothetical protein
LPIGIDDWRLGLTTGDWDWRLAIGIGDWRLGLTIGDWIEDWGIGNRRFDRHSVDSIATPSIRSPLRQFNRQSVNVNHQSPIGNSIANPPMPIINPQSTIQSSIDNPNRNRQSSIGNPLIFNLQSSVCNGIPP